LGISLRKLDLALKQAGKWNAIAVVALRAKSNRLGDTRPLMPALLALLPNIKPGTGDVSS
jgi:hypothetical protein